MVRIDMATVAAREKRFGEYGNAVWFIYGLFAKRLRRRKLDQKLTNYQIAGFENKEAYDNADSFRKVVSVKNVANITSFTPKLYTDSNAYLVPSIEYCHRFVATMGFKDVYECLWGSTDEISQYLPELFEVMCDEAVQHQNRLGRLLHELEQQRPIKIKNSSHDQLYLQIKDELVDEWNKFTRAEKQEKILATVVEIRSVSEREVVDASFPIVDNIDPENFTDTVVGEFLGFRKLDVALSRFIDNRVTKLVMKQYILQITK